MNCSFHHRSATAAKSAAAAGTAAVLALALSGCGSGSTGDSGDKPIVIGTMDAVSSLDPAGAYDRPSGTLFANVFQTLLSIPPNSATPVPEAAKSCRFDDDTTYRCTLRSGLKFTNQDPLTSTDVKFSFDRMKRIKAPQGPQANLSGLKKVDTPDAHTVVFHLTGPDATFPSKIATEVGYIVDHKVYPANKLMENPSKVVGSGPYKLASYTKAAAKLQANPGYSGKNKPKNSAVTIRYFKADEKAQMKQDLAKHKIDIIDRGLEPSDIDEYRAADTKGKLALVEGTGAEIRYLVLNTKVAPLDKPDVRRALANIVNPAEVTAKAHGTSAEALYSMIPQGLAGHLTPFYDDYPKPSKAKAAQLLHRAGVSAPVKLDLWYTPTHYGAASKKDMQVVQAELNNSGLFKASLHSLEWSQYVRNATGGKYPVYEMGWFADYPDPDNYTTPLVGKAASIGNGFTNRTIDDVLVPKTQRETNRTKAAALYEQIQKITAQEVPEIPLWQSKQYAVSGSDIGGLQWTLDGTTALRLWGLTRGLA